MTHMHMPDSTYTMRVAAAAIIMMIMNSPGIHSSKYT